MCEKRRVVVTGMGMITPIGNGVKESWENLLQKKSGIKRISLFDTSGFNCKIAGQIVEEDFEEMECNRGTYWGLLASNEALKSAGIFNDDAIMKEMSIFIGNSGSRTSLKNFDKEFKQKKLKTLSIENLNSDEEFDKNRYSAAAEYLSRQYHISGGCYSITTACASGTQALGMAYQKIKDGESKIILAGGCDAMISEIDLIGFCMLGAVTDQYNDNPTAGSRPFNKDRSGFVLGEGGGMLILEDMEHAKKRNAQIYAEVVGFGNTISGYSILDTPPDGAALAAAMEKAIEEAEIEKSAIRYINAHGTSTRDNDSSETAAIQKVFGELASNIPVSSTKSATGHLISGAGAIEAIFTVMAIKDECLPPTLNLEDIDGKCNLCHIYNPMKEKIDYAMSNSLGFGGSNSSIIFRRCTE